ncbi:MAG: NAD-binding protein [Betaproteobacteria bacterium]
MGGVVFLFLRRMRAPLIVLIASYAIALLGLVLMPGVDPAGRPWRMSFFHAFYLLAYTATTTGFGELPYPYSDAQRMWVTFSLYTTVIAWLYAVGKIIALLQDPPFQRVLAGTRFARQTRALREPFVIVCGYGETGSVLVEALDARRVRSAVIDIDAGRVSEVDLRGHAADVYALCADARLPESLLAAGLRNSECRGLVALTDDDGANLAAAVASKLLRPKLPVLARCESSSTGANMDSFGTDHIINPFEVFARELGLAVHAPSQYLLREWLTAVPGTPLVEPLQPPRGLWIVCGYGRFGRAVSGALESEGISIRVIEPDPVNIERADTVRGSGTEAPTLREAGIDEAVAIVAGTSDDVNNFSIAMTARELNPRIFVVMRKNRRHNEVLFEAFAPELIMQPSQVVATECLAALTTPLLARFLAMAERESNDWANELVSRIAGLDNSTPEIWSVAVTPAGAPAAWREAAGAGLRLEHLLLDHANRANRLDAIVLMLDSDGRDSLLPDDSVRLERGAVVLFCGTAAARSRLLFAVNHRNAMHYAATGEILHGALWNLLKRGPQS